MSAVEQLPERPLDFVTAEEYLAGELISRTKHEYLGGRIHAMAGASGPHNVISQNLAGMLYNRLRKTGCRFFGSDMKLKFALPEERYYYPDGMIVCHPKDFRQDYTDQPSVVFEILSEETRRVDEREKSAAYRLLNSVESYVLIEQVRAELIVVRRTGRGWEGHQYAGLEAEAELGVHGLTLPLAELYEDIVFP